MSITDLINDFDSNFLEQEQILAIAARNAETGIKGDSEVFKAFTALHFFTLTVDFDMRVMLRTLLAHPNSRLTAEKFLVLTLEEAEESVNKLVNVLLGAIRNAASDDLCKELFDFEKIKSAKNRFNEAMQPLRDDREFMQTMRLIRNTVSAHVVGDQVGIQNSVIWVLSRENVARDESGVLKSRFVHYSVEVLKALNTLTRDLTHSQNPVS